MPWNLTLLYYHTCEPSLSHIQGQNRSGIRLPGQALPVHVAMKVRGTKWGGSHMPNSPVEDDSNIDDYWKK